MTTLPVIEDRLATIVLALTPVQRWDAVSKPFNLSFMTERWFIITMVVAIVILCVLFLIVSKRTPAERKAASRLFDEFADKSGLSERERQILLAIAGYAGLVEIEAIFTMGSAFDRGAAKMVEESYAWRGHEGSMLLKIELSYLREKLGLQKQRLSPIGSTTKPKKLSSRQIPVGRKVHITRRTSRISDEIEAAVVENNDIELMLRVPVPVKITFGEVWRVHYYFGASVWEFDTSMVSYDGDVLILNHSDDVRFINRRRFLRVPVDKPAFIARFPFTRAPAGKGGSGEKAPDVEQDSASASGDAWWGPPEFMPAVVTELAGPGLRIEVPLEVKAGERVLVVFKLDDEKDQESSLQETGEISTSKVVQDIGEVRHTKAVQNGFSIAVELVGLSDTDVDGLVRATNVASLRAGAAGEGMPASVNAEERAPEPSAAQGA